MFQLGLHYPPVNSHRPCQIGLGRWVSIQNWWFSGSMLIYQSVNVPQSLFFIRETRFGVSILIHCDEKLSKSLICSREFPLRPHRNSHVWYFHHLKSPQNHHIVCCQHVYQLHPSVLPQKQLMTPPDAERTKERTTVLQQLLHVSGALLSPRGKEASDLRKDGGWPRSTAR